jgi:hypothetical protein
MKAKASKSSASSMNSKKVIPAPKPKKGDSRSKSMMAPIKPQKGC